MLGPLMPLFPQSRSMAALRSGALYFNHRSSGCTPFRAATRSAGRHPAATAAFKGCDGALEKPIKVVGMGSCGVDYLATVAKYPRPDEKLRSETLEVQGGGNCANALTAAARLGLSPVIVTKIGGDGLGDGIITELKADGVDTAHIMRAAGAPSPFTYIIVDRAGGTRTCIHTPGAPMTPDDITGPGAPAGFLDAVLSGAALVYFDGRLTEAAVLLAARARELGVPVLVEAERLRPGLEGLLALADYVVTSAHYPQESTGEADVMDAVLETARRLPNARFVITTLGKRGSVMLVRHVAASTAESVPVMSLSQVASELDAELEAGGGQGAGEEVDCVSRTGVGIRAGRVASTSSPVALTFSASRNAEAASAQAIAAAQRAAELNADAQRGSKYASSASGVTAIAIAAAQTQGVVTATVLRAAAGKLPAEAVVDTTGAGDSFIGSVLYGLSTGLSYPRMLQLGGVVAACKCTELGARPGLPHCSGLARHLLHDS